jgi:hypothetical protein
MQQFGNTMWVLWGDNVTKWNLTIVDVIIAWLAKKNQ